MITLKKYKNIINYVRLYKNNNFDGLKVIKVIDDYAKKYNIPDEEIYNNLDIYGDIVIETILLCELSELENRFSDFIVTLSA